MACCFGACCSREGSSREEISCQPNTYRDREGEYEVVHHSRSQVRWEVESGNRCDVHAIEGRYGTPSLNDHESPSPR